MKSGPCLEVSLFGPSRWTRSDEFEGAVPASGPEMLSLTTWSWIGWREIVL